MESLARKVCSNYILHLDGLLRMAQTPSPIAVAAGMIREAYLQAERAGQIDPEQVRLTVETANQLVGFRDHYRLLTCKAYLGLFNTVNPAVIWVGTEQNIAPKEQPHKMANFLLECVYLPLLMRYRAAGRVVGHIANEPAWLAETVPFASNPDHYLQVRGAKSTWVRIRKVHAMAKLGGLERAYLTERNLSPASSVGKGKSHFVANQIAAQTVATLRQTASVLVFYADDYPDVSAQIAGPFLGRPVQERECRRPNDQAMAAIDYADPADGHRRRIIIAKHMAWGGLKDDELLPLSRLVREAVRSRTEDL